MKNCCRKLFDRVGNWKHIYVPITIRTYKLNTPPDDICQTILLITGG